MLQRIKAIILALFVCVGVMAQSYRTVQVGGLGFNVSNDYEMELEEDDGFYIATLTCYCRLMKTFNPMMRW